MEYKVGDEVLVKAKIISGSRKYFGVEVEGERFDVCEGNIVPVPDMTAEEAWEIAGKIETIGTKEKNEVFGFLTLVEIIYNFSPQEAKAKIEAWESEKEIKVGDEVVPKEGHYRNGERGLAVCVDGLGRIGVNHPRNDFTWYEKGFLKKTGRHIDIDALLDQKGENK